MSVAYFDTSALLKRYVSEAGSKWVRTYLTTPSGPVVFSSALTAIEITCAFARRLRDGTLTPALHTMVVEAFDYDVANRYHLLDVAPATLEAARRLATEH